MLSATSYASIMALAPFPVSRSVRTWWKRLLCGHERKGALEGQVNGELVEWHLVAPAHEQAGSHPLGDGVLPA